jgi:bacterioferritin-associated ferredoxin
MHLDDHQRFYTGEATELVCECLSVERQEIRVAIVEGANTVLAVRQSCQAGGGCGSCHAEISRLILNHQWATELDFGNQLMQLPLTSAAAPSLTPATVAQFFQEVIAPRLAFYNLAVRVLETNLEPVIEVVIDLPNADPALKYTLSFWIDIEFQRHFSPAATLIIN